MPEPYFQEDGITIYHGDSASVLRGLPDNLVDCCVTSPPYWGFRDYGVTGQIGFERTPEEFQAALEKVFAEVFRVLKPSGTLWLNLGDVYANDGKWGGETGGKQSYLSDNDRKRVGREKRVTGLKGKDLVGIPWRLAFSLQAAGWYLRSDIIWHKPNVMPENVNDRPTKAHEYLFLMSKSERYFYNSEAIQEPSISDHGSGNGFKREARSSYMNGNGLRGNDEPWRPNGMGTRNKRSVWTIPTQPFPEAHFATFPTALVRPCILAGCPAGGVVLDPFMGSGTTVAVARSLQCKGIGIELNADYIGLAMKRLAQGTLMGTDEEASACQTPYAKPGKPTRC
jgi:DNA modification methylase